jgi:L-aspartate oxidase
MWEKIGIVREGSGLEGAVEALAAWSAPLVEARHPAGYELRHLLPTARLMAEAALMRTESRGAHWRSDYAQPSEAWLRHISFRRDAE